MSVTFHGGPWDGLEVELPEVVDKLLIVDDRGRIHRYETDGEWEVITQTQGGERIEAGGDMVLTTDVAEYDAELLEALGSNWKDAN